MPVGNPQIQFLTFSKLGWVFKLYCMVYEKGLLWHKMITLLNKRNLVENKTEITQHA